jgi:hypothetical protein
MLRSKQEVAEPLDIIPGTTSAYATKILGECRSVWEMPDDQAFRFYFLREKFKKCSGQDIRENSEFFHMLF